MQDIISKVVKKISFNTRWFNTQFRKVQANTRMSDEAKARKKEDEQFSEDVLWILLVYLFPFFYQFGQIFFHEDSVWGFSLVMMFPSWFIINIFAYSFHSEGSQFNLPRMKIILAYRNTLMMFIIILLGLGLGFYFTLPKAFLLLVLPYFLFHYSQTRRKNDDGDS
tara:strand:+ start:125 stop:622 length:498 start_codon:yes stop_codon:yes gene_type:complete